MSYSNNSKAEAFVASGDLSACLNRVVMQLTTDFKVGLATAGGVVGVLLNAPKDGETASVATDGITMVRVGAAVTANDYLTAAASGWAITATGPFAARTDILGKARTGAASGMLAAVDLSNFAFANSAGA